MTANASDMLMDVIRLAGKRINPSGVRNMADNKTLRGSADRSRVAAMEDYEVKYLAQKHGVTQKLVKEAVAKVGTSRSKVETELKARQTDGKGFH